MRFFTAIIFSVLWFFTACSQPAPKTETPLDVLKAYMQAFKKKDTTQMKLLLSAGSLKMADEEAKAQNVVLDDIIKRETLFSENQTRVEFKNEKIDGETASIEVKNSYGSWDIVPFIKEDGEWRIAKERYLEEQTKKSEEEMKKLDQQINQGIPDATLPANLSDANANANANTNTNTNAGVNTNTLPQTEETKKLQPEDEDNGNEKQ